jgi:hypothetical protein
MKILKADYIWGMLATIQFSGSCLPTSSPNTQNHNFTSCFIRVWNLVSYTKGRTHIEGIWEGMLRRIFGLKKEQVAGDWRRQYIEKLHKLYASPNRIKAIK